LYLDKRLLNVGTSLLSTIQLADQYFIFSSPNLYSAIPSLPACPLIQPIIIFCISFRSSGIVSPGHHDVKLVAVSEVEKVSALYVAVIENTFALSIAEGV